jgi:hypothetical protein
MASLPILPHFFGSKQLRGRIWRFSARGHLLPPSPARSPLSYDLEDLPHFVRESPVAMRYWRLLSPLAWDRFPERDLCRNWGQACVPMAPFAAACLVKLDLGFSYMSQLRDYLLDHPALIWVLGFPVVSSSADASDIDAQASLPTHRHFTRLLRRMPNTCLQFLLDDTVRLLQAELANEVQGFGRTIALDTKHILAWVEANNRKAYVSHRYDKSKPPQSDPDCRLGCKRRHNQRISSKEPPTPVDNPVPAGTVSVGEYYWGYASGVVATKVPDWGEFVLAELTQAFDRSDVSYFFPLMADVERRLGFRPPFAAFDAAFDAFPRRGPMGYVYDYFHREAEAGFAAVPFSKRGGHEKSFDANGLPLCQAGLPMPLKYIFWSKKTTLVEHERGRHVCPLLYPKPTDDACPIQHKQWPKGGCTTTIPTSIGARLRYQLDRQSDAYKEVYKQRTATERINSQAVALGIERPKLRNRQAITNQNSLIYILINLRALHRVRRKKAAQADPASSASPDE